MNIGERLREEREHMGYSQTSFADIGGASKGSQIAWEKGTAFPNAEFLAAIASKRADAQYILTGQRSVNWPPREPHPMYPLLLERLQAVMHDANHEEIGAFAGEIGEKVPYMRRVMTGELPLLAETLLKLARHTEVDCNWLLRVWDEDKKLERVEIYNPLPAYRLTREEKELFGIFRTCPGNGSDEILQAARKILQTKAMEQELADLREKAAEQARGEI